MNIFHKVTGLCCGVLCATAVLTAGTITFNTPSNSTVSVGGETQSVDATATFTTSPGTLTVTLENLVSNIHDAGQVLSDLQFSLSTGGTASLFSSSGQEVTVNSGGSKTTGSTVSTGWGFGTLSGGLILCDVCPGGVSFQTNPSATPSHTIIPTASSYPNANKSIAGNGPHNPFLDGTVSFTIDDSLFTANTTVDSAIFSFSTASGVDVTGVPNTPGVPEPVSLALTGAGLVGLVGSMRLKRRFSRA